MKRSALTGALTLAVSGLLITAVGTPASATDDARPEPPRASKSEARHDAQKSLEQHPKAVRADDHDTFESTAVKVDKDGTRHVHFDRLHRGLPVLGGDVIVHSTPDGALRETSLSLKKPLCPPTRR